MLFSDRCCLLFVVCLCACCLSLSVVDVVVLGVVCVVLLVRSSLLVVV